MKIRFAYSAGGGAADPEVLGHLVDEAEASGFDSLWFSDLTVLGETDPLLAVAFAASRSHRLHLGVNLVPFGYEPYVLARQLAQLDHLARGRLLVTLVPGLDLPTERAALGTAGVHRGRRMDAVVPLLRAWWAGGPVDPTADTAAQAGPNAHSDVTDPGSGSGSAARLAVLPRQQPLEIWLGGSGPEAIRRAGRLADGWLGSLVTPPDAGRVRQAIVAEAEAAGRCIDPEHFGLSVVYARSAEEAEQQRPRLARRRPRPGEVVPPVPVGRRELRTLIDQLVHEGLSKFVVRPIAPSDDVGADIRWAADALLDLQT